MFDLFPLTRPLAFIDLESTGTSPSRDRIIEIAILKLHPDGTEEFRCKRVNPRVPIPPAATAVHGITDADVADEPGFGAYASGVDAFLRDCDVAGYGILHFDLPLLRAEMRRTRGIDFRWRDRAVIDAMTIFHQREPRDLAAAVRKYAEHEFRAHAAMDDVRATLHVLRGQFEHYDDLPADLQALSAYCNPERDQFVDHDGRLRWEDQQIALGFGKYEGRTLRSVIEDEREYLEWVLTSDFEAEMKDVIRNALAGSWPPAPTP